ncbi:hypothetical protein [Oricola sp.]|uniref:hypothetical protein n=1 Tax=Oricola sp. TaxID=1979950 RepID=UPI0025F2E1FF|nr:hypothetical protein [Oricola sp.]MCI5076431.1 hypothetical protein [Oricola sp.]
MPHFIRIHEYIRQFRVGDAASAARFRELVLAALENRRKEFATEIAELDALHYALQVAAENGSTTEVEAASLLLKEAVEDLATKLRTSE